MHDALLMVLKDYVHHNLLVEIMNLFIKILGLQEWQRQSRSSYL